ncbi:unnamed protein product [Spirodela intermedia]|uniref:Phospholipase D n=1 Tax=Spirodela intermedia TaxID=51605 RepID=A0A7I8JTW2_SPIIN|nr:unnamed protein product [Spirodela intermedia]CAA6673529.1 unnamed protein product [Spirodela intermedia]
MAPPPPPPPPAAPVNGAPFSSNRSSSEDILLHGDLDLWIFQARSLPNMDMFSVRLHQCIPSCCVSGQQEEVAASAPASSPSQIHQSFRYRRITSDPTLLNAEFPVWNEHFVFPVAHPTSFVEFLVKENDIFGAENIGTVKIPASRVVSGISFGLVPIIGSSGKPPKPDSALLISLQYKPLELNASYKYGIAGDGHKSGVQGTYFPVRKGGLVTLYQDTHVNNGDLPEIKLEGGKAFDHAKCWEDICQAILEARHLIYIVGWSVYDKVRLVREPTRSFPEAASLTLGELLKHKSQEGVRVCLLIWDDRTSRDNLILKTEGVMQTHDEETRRFFKHSSVICLLSPRDASSKLSLFRQQFFLIGCGKPVQPSSKCVLVDTQASENTRKITAFMGGLDLCDGRYDTPRHRLFKDLNTVFLNDFHNPTFSVSVLPRQPWHDLHCKIEGPAAYDVLKNFEQRWQKATKWWKLRQYLRTASRHGEDALLELERIPWIISPSLTVPDDHPSLSVSKENDPGNWHIQVFRSIDSGSVKGFPKTVRDAENKNLVCQKNLKVDKSIHTAYVKAIRSAKHFIYIENQYFIGSSYGWPSRNPGADNLIPMELALKIASKIRARERFAVYVVIPMWPEGCLHLLLYKKFYFGSQTIKMMYGIVAQAIKSSNLSLHPTDYLNFYCLGNREPVETAWSTNPTSESSTAASVQRNRRFMIYVHSKGMIVDDEYVIIGSANINQRSLAGSRDTEIAMGAYQPHHTWSGKNRHPRGTVYGYRMSLWAEHLGLVNPILEEPHTVECVRSVNSIADGNWKRFTSEKMTSLQGHLLKYPISVGADGKVGCLPGQEEFPDVGGKILGSDTPLPDALTM